MDELPEFPEGLVAFVATAGDAGPHVIPVSALHRAGPRRLLLALTHRRGTLARLRTRPEVAVALAGAGFAVTAYGRAAAVAGAGSNGSTPTLPSTAARSPSRSNAATVT